MTDQFSSYRYLRESYKIGVDYRITAVNRGGNLLIAAPHAGGIERGTSELTQAIAREDFSYYLFEGLIHNSRHLHITSTRFDEPTLLELVSQYPHCVTIHGCDEPRPVLYVGGKDSEFKAALIAQLAARGQPVELGIGDFAGNSLNNICNRTSIGAGIQLEVSKGLRQRIFLDWSRRAGRRTITRPFSCLVSDIRLSIQQALSLIY